MEANYIFPNTKDKVDAAGLMQQSICYDKNGNWTVPVSWGYVVQIFRGTFLVRDMELPRRTFVDWHHKVDNTAFSFNTGPNSMHKCQIPFVYYISTAKNSSNKNETATEYLRHQTLLPNCEWQIPTPSQIKRVEVYKTPNPYSWDKVIKIFFFFLNEIEGGRGDYCDSPPRGDHRGTPVRECWIES